MYDFKPTLTCVTLLTDSRLINPLSTEHEAAHCMNVSQPRILAADASTWPALYGAANRQGLSKLQVISMHNTQSPFQNVRIYCGIVEQH